MPRTGFEPTIPVFERLKAVRALDIAAIGTGLLLLLLLLLLFAMLGGSLVATSWRVFRLRMEGRPPDTEGSCECIE
jgi:hypothetical protein